jgi:hypothetical protein
MQPIPRHVGSSPPLTGATAQTSADSQLAVGTGRFVVAAHHFLDDDASPPKD